MANYIVLINWTEQGIANVRDALDRQTKATSLAKKVGCKLKNSFWTIGPYDVVANLEAPDDESVTAFLLAVGIQGNARTTTMRAFDRNEMAAILNKVPG
jgi:uncharacterized protein with GYD domain